MKLSDFYFTGDDYRYRFEAEAKQRFIDLIRDRFNSGVTYNGRVLKWDTVIQEKTNELARYLNRRTQRLDLIEPSPVLESTDSRAVRKAILGLTQSEAMKRGIGKSTLHYLRRRAANSTAIRIYGAVKNRLNEEPLQEWVD